MNRNQRRKQRVNVDDLFYLEKIISIDEWHDEWHDAATAADDAATAADDTAAAAAERSPDAEDAAATKQNGATPAEPGP